MQNNYDVIIVGGGFAGAHAAYPLVQSGLSVAMLDGGVISSKHDIPDLAFEDFRKKQSDQAHLFLGEDFSGIMPPDIRHGHGGSMLSGSKKYVGEKTDEFLPIQGDAVVLQSLAKGGLGEVWGAAGDFFNAEELQSIGITENLEFDYQEIVDRIGVSGTNKKFKLQPPPRPDNNARAVIQQAETGKKNLENLGYTVAQPPMALLTEAKDGREATKYQDMDYWHDAQRSVYRPRFTIEELQKSDNFSYISGIVVRSVADEETGVMVSGKNISTGEQVTFKASKVILAAGAPNTVRILLRSLNLYGIKVPFFTKPHVLIPCFQPAMLGKAVESKRHSLCQLVISNNKKATATADTFAQLYSYRSLLSFKLTDYFPFAKPESLALASLLAPLVMVADVRFGWVDGTESRIALERDSAGDYLEIYPHAYNSEYAKEQDKKINKLKKALRAVGLLPVKVIKPKYETASHYGGGIVPIGSQGSPLQADDSGKMSHSGNIYVADSSLWCRLPAGPPTLTIMANANRIAKKVLDALSAGSR